MTREDAFFNAVLERNTVRPRVAAIVVSDGKLLVQRPVDEPDTCYAFIGGEYEVGDTFESRIRSEFEEETNAKVLHAEYLFCVEHRFDWKGKLVHSLEHYLEVSLDRTDVANKEPHLAQHWLPVSSLREHDLYPIVVRDAIASCAFRTIRHLVEPYPG